MLRTVKVLINKADFFLKNALLSFFSKILFPGADSIAMKRKIIVFRTGSLGDTICAMPSIESIKGNFPTADIDMLTESGGQNLVSVKNLLNEETINEFIFYKEYSLKELIQKLRIQKYDLFIFLPQAHAPFKSIIRNLIFAKLIRVRSVIGFQICVTRLFPKIQAKYRTIPNVRDFLLSLLEKENIPTNAFRNTYNFHITKNDKEYVESIFLNHGINNNENLIAITIGAKRPQHRWPVEYFDNVIEFLLNESYKCIIIGGPEDRSLVNSLVNNEKVVDLTGKLSPVQSGLAISNCRLCITNDTGPMHLSYAFGTRTIAIFSSRDYPNLWYPPAELSYVFRNNDIHCSECFTETCSDNQCMKQILPNQVIERLKIELRI